MAPRQPFSYTEAKMAAAIQAVTQGMAKCRAAKTFGVPKTTLLDKLTGRTPIQRRMGRCPYLTRAEEVSIVNWIEQGLQRGLPPHLNDVLNSAQLLVNNDPGRVTPFKDGRPGTRWFKAFQRRNPSVSVRIPERVSKARATVTEASIRQWFHNLEKNINDLGASDVFQDPSRIYNCDETNIRLCPDTGKVIGIRGWKNVYELSPGPVKSNLTFVGTFSADGNIITPTIIYPYIRVPRDIIESVPSGFFIANTESGWMKAECFYEYIKNAFNPWLEENTIKKPVLLFVDGHCTHLTLQTSELCEEIGIILYLLPPNTTHILQPADVGPFKPLKDYWKQEIHNFQRENVNSVVRRANVAPLLERVLSKIKRSSIINGFGATGIYPLDPNRVDYSKCLDIHTEKVQDQLVTHGEPEEFDEHKECLQYNNTWKILKKEIGQEKLLRIEEGEGLSHLETMELFSKIQNKAYIEEINKDLPCLPDHPSLPYLPSLPSSANESPKSDTSSIFTLFEGFTPDNSSFLQRTLKFSAQNKENCPATNHRPATCILAKQNPTAYKIQSNKYPLKTMPSSHPSTSVTSTPGLLWDQKIHHTASSKSPIHKVISSDIYRKKIIEKRERTKSARRKQISDDWRCSYCDKLWSTDNKRKNGKIWINCDVCNIKMHQMCINLWYRTLINLDPKEERNDDIEFVCESCFKKNNDIET